MCVDTLHKGDNDDDDDDDDDDNDDDDDDDNNNNNNKSRSYIIQPYCALHTNAEITYVKVHKMQHRKLHYVYHEL